MYAAQYERYPSDEQIQDETNGINRSLKRKRQRTKVWIKESVFDNAAEVKASGCEGEDWNTLTLTTQLPSLWKKSHV